VARDTAKTQNKSKVVLYAMAAVVIVLAVAAKLVIGGPKAATADTSRAADSAARTTAVVPAGTGTTQSAKTDSVKPDSVIASAPVGSSSVANGSVAANTQSVSDQLSALVDDSNTRTKGSDVLRKLAQLESRVHASVDFLVLASLKANVAKAKGDSAGACEALKAIRPKLDRGDLVNLRDRAQRYQGCELPE
jgi:hypothetical protein